uniref:Uncharacterized protein n=1 Tax=viral metagenome TaxID=1070528 RepID=A0A6C0DH71_9ZZZZ
MANTRFYYDPCRTKKQLQQSTGPGRYMLNVPGNGSNPCYIEDPQIIIQKWGANLRTNTINLESDLMGVNRQLSKDCLGKDNYKNYNVENKPIQYPTCNNLYTEQSRATNPAWWYRDLEQVDWYYPPLNPQENTCFPFESNLSTRILEKDYFTPKRECVLNESNNLLPTSFNLIKGGFPGGSNTCAQTNSCEFINVNKS